MRASGAALTALAWTILPACPTCFVSPSGVRSLPPLFAARAKPDPPELPPLTSEHYSQSMSKDERRENVEKIREIYKADLVELQRKRDYAGWVDMRKELKKRKKADPWFELNDRLKEAVQLDETEDADAVSAMIEKVGGPPPGVTPTREYALASDVYDIGMSLSRAESIARYEQTKLNAVRWKKQIAERVANEEAEEEEWKNNPFKAEEDAKIRREKSMKKIYASIEERRIKAEEKAKDIRKQYEGKMGQGSALDRALEAAKRSMQQEGSDLIDQKMDNPNPDKNVNVDSNGRPRMPGDPDVTRGEITVPILNASEVTTDDLTVKVTSNYNADQSDPPMRKHCFSYKIQITNNSPADTVQLLSRRFEIQTVGARQKDIVQGKGVTGRQPVLKPGETFEYTSTAPLSVRPIGTTIIAARMKGTYSYTVVDPKTQESRSDDDKDGPKAEFDPEDVKEAELGTFHFIFPPDQRVKRTIDADASDDDDDEDDAPSLAATPPKPVSSSPNTLPGDADVSSGDISPPINDRSVVATDGVEVSCTTQYREERSDPKLDKYCFSYQIKITNNDPSGNDIQLLSRRFEIQTVGSDKKDVVEGKGVTGRQPVLKPGESFEYTSTAPLSVKSMAKTPVLARMMGEYGFKVVGPGKDGAPEKKAKLGVFHFVLPQVA